MISHTIEFSKGTIWPFMGCWTCIFSFRILLKQQNQTFPHLLDGTFRDLSNFIDQLIIPFVYLLFFVGKNLIFLFEFVLLFLEYLDFVLFFLSFLKQLIVFVIEISHISLQLIDLIETWSVLFFQLEHPIL